MFTALKQNHNVIPMRILFVESKVVTIRYEMKRISFYKQKMMMTNAHMLFNGKFINADEIRWNSILICRTHNIALYICIRNEII